MAVYAFIGFEDMFDVAEEVKDVKHLTLSDTNELRVNNTVIPSHNGQRYYLKAAP